LKLVLPDTVSQRASRAPTPTGRGLPGGKRASCVWNEIHKMGLDFIRILLPVSTTFLLLSVEQDIPDS
jgi:hypothetical protein